MPLLWPHELYPLLPAGVSKLVDEQRLKFTKDWAIVSSAFPQSSHSRYLHSWLLVNTRTFYYTSSDSTSEEHLARDDCMALNPFADSFNHTDCGGCSVSFSSQGYRISASHPIKKGSEVYISYGNHSNDFLLAEYGFLLDRNRWDEVCLDSDILPRLSSTQRVMLKNAGFLDHYMLDAEGVCHRTQVALRIMLWPLERWRRYVDGLEDEETDQYEVNHLLLKVLESYRTKAAQRHQQASSIDPTFATPKRLLTVRWAQIILLIQTTMKRLQN